MSMPPVTVVAGAILVVLGVGTFFGTGSSHFTALIPAVFGGVLVALGVLGYKDGLRKHVMHAAAGLSLVGLVAAAVMGAGRLPQLLQEGRTTRVVEGVAADSTVSTLAILGMGLVCLVHLGLCVNSFIQARRAMKS